MNLPQEFTTSPIPLWTIADIAEELQYSREWIYTLESRGIIVPQRKSLRGRSLFEPEYLAWAKVNVPIIAKRMSDLGL